MPLFGGPNLDDVIFQLKFSGKQLEREAKRAEKEEKVLRKKVTKAIKEKNIEFAQVHAGLNFTNEIFKLSHHDYQIFYLYGNSK